MEKDKVWRNTGGPLPYIGPLDERREKLGSAHVLSTCGSDLTGKTTYRYNSHGYRGEEFRSDARLRIYTFGESDAFGLGIDYQDAWPVRVVELIRVQLGLQAGDICHINFSEPGGSNDLIARMVVAQCGAAPPDLVLVNFAETNRTEGVCRGRVFGVGRWFQHCQELRDKILKMPDDEGQPNVFVEALHRGDAYLEFTNDDHGRLAAVRCMLLVQSYLQARNIPSLATSRPMPELFASSAAVDPVSGPLIEQVSADWYRPFELKWPPIDGSADELHMGPRSHSRIAEHIIGCLQTNGALDALQRRMAAPAADGATAAGVRRSIGESVRCFYEDMPFSMHGDVNVAAASVRDHSLAAIYPDLHAVLLSGRKKSVLEFGCGAGWLACTMAHHYDVVVTAVDFSEAALHRARQVAESLGVVDRIRFVRSDLFDYEHGTPVDLVVSVGVLHHTRDARAAFRHAQASVGDAGSLFVGLYHEPGRAPFLELFRGIAKVEGEDAALARYAKLDGVHAGDKTMLKSWFRDQVLHPHETQHTLREVCGWLAEHGLSLSSTSINRFEPIENVDSLFALEQTFGERSRQANLTEGRYYPGFFTVLAGRP